jgi:ribosomal-protein-alanine N-acetyltransferase
LTSDSADQAWLAATSIEPMRPEHLDAVLAIERLSFPSAWSRESYLRELRNPNSYYFVARLEGNVIGHAGMWTLGDEAHISTLAVHPDRRRHGLARRLLSHLMAFARERRLARITLEVRAANRAAQALYREFGFEEKGLLPRYYGDTGENGIVMCKLLSQEESNTGGNSESAA